MARAAALTRNLKATRLFVDRLRLSGIGFTPGVAEGAIALSEGSASRFDSIPGGAILWAGRWNEWRVPGRDGLARVVGIILSDRTAPSLPVSMGGRVVVGGVELDLLRDGENASIDGDRGIVDLAEVREIQIVTSFLERDDGRVLLLKRSERVGSFRGRWAAVSGFLEDPTPFAQAVREIEEETGLRSEDLALLREGARVLARDGDRIYTVHPFLFRVHDPEIRIDWEHTEFEWVEPAEIVRRETVPKLEDVWQAVRPDAPSGGQK